MRFNSLTIIVFIAISGAIAIALSVALQKPEDQKIVVELACGATLGNSLIDLGRSWEYFNFSVQGIFYTDNGSVKLTATDITKVLKSFESNKNFVKKADHDIFTWESFVVGKHLFICQVDQLSNEINYSYILW